MLNYLPRRVEPSEAHVVRVVPNVLPAGCNSVYQFKVVCSCQWEALALNEAHAEAYAAQHRGAHGIIG